MRSVSLLLRLAQRELEERRSDLGSINRAQTETEALIGRLDEAVDRETSIAMADPAAIASFGSWAGQAARGRAQLRSRVAALDVSAQAALDSLREAAAQARRLEIVLDSARAKERRRSLRQADARADERELARRAATPSDE